MFRKGRWVVSFGIDGIKIEKRISSSALFGFSRDGSNRELIEGSWIKRHGKGGGAKPDRSAIYGDDTRRALRPQRWLRALDIPLAGTSRYLRWNATSGGRVYNYLFIWRRIHLGSFEPSFRMSNLPSNFYCVFCNSSTISKITGLSINYRIVQQGTFIISPNKTNKNNNGLKRAISVHQQIHHQRRSFVGLVPSE